jgi:hypothetical protein
MPRSPRRRIRLVTVVGELAVLRKPGWAFKTSADLTPATGARTTRFCRTQPPVSAKRLYGLWRRSSGVPRSLTENRPAIPSAPDAAASTASHPNVRDDGQRPLVRDETAGVMDLIWGKREGIYFCRGVWTGQITLIWLKKLASGRTSLASNRVVARTERTGRATARPITGSAKSGAASSILSMFPFVIGHGVTPHGAKRAFGQTTV